MTNINEREIISLALKTAINKENLHTRSAAQCLNLNPCYISMAQNPNSFDSMGKTAWLRLEEWYNTNESLKLFRIPEGEEIWKPREKEVSVERKEEKKEVSVERKAESVEKKKEPAAVHIDDNIYPTQAIAEQSPTLKQLRINHFEEANLSAIKTAVENKEIKKAVKKLAESEITSLPIETQRLKIALDIEINLVINGHRIQI